MLDVDWSSWGCVPIIFSTLAVPDKIFEGKICQNPQQCYTALGSFTERGTWLLLGGGKSTCSGCALQLSLLNMFCSSSLQCFRRQTYWACILLSLWYRGGVCQLLIACGHSGDDLPQLQSAPLDIPPLYSGSQLFLNCRFFTELFCPLLKPQITNLLHLIKIFSTSLSKYIIHP